MSQPSQDALIAKRIDDALAIMQQVEDKKEESGPKHAFTAYANGDGPIRILIAPEQMQILQKSGVTADEILKTDFAQTFQQVPKEVAFSMSLAGTEKPEHMPEVTNFIIEIDHNQFKNALHDYRDASRTPSS